MADIPLQWQTKFFALEKQNPKVLQHSSVNILSFKLQEMLLPLTWPLSAHYIQWKTR
jgi:hypothetical protein